MFKQLYQIGKSLNVADLGYQEYQAQVIELDSLGNFLNLQPPTLLSLPKLVRSKNIKPQFLADKKAYLIGKYQNLFLALLAESQLKYNSAIINYLTSDCSSKQQIAENKFYTFSVNEILVAQTKEAIKFWQDYLYKEAPLVFCSVLGEYLPSKQPFVAGIKGLKNAHATGATLFAQPHGSNISYGQKQHPLSTKAVETIEKGLTKLIFDHQKSFEVFGYHFCFYCEDSSIDLARFACHNNDGKVCNGNNSKFYCIVLKACDKKNAGIIDFWEIPTNEAVVNLKNWFELTNIPNKHGNKTNRFSSVSYFFNCELDDPQKRVKFFGQDAINLVRAMYLGEKINDLFKLKLLRYLALNQSREYLTPVTAIVNYGVQNHA